MELFKANMFLKMFGLTKIPLILFINPQVSEMHGPRSVVKIKLGYRTRNHLNSMYFGVLCVGAELCVALKAVQAIVASKQKIDFVFKDFKTEFLKRADGHVYFICDQAAEVEALIEKAKTSNERLEKKFYGIATLDPQSTDAVMRFEVTLSVKNRSLRKS